MKEREDSISESSLVRLGYSMERKHVIVGKDLHPYLAGLGDDITIVLAD